MGKLLKLLKEFSASRLSLDKSNLRAVLKLAILSGDKNKLCILNLCVCRRVCMLSKPAIYGDQMKYRAANKIFV